MNLIIAFFLKPFLIVATSLLVGLTFGILPYSVFPFLSAKEITWRGHKSERPHLALQFWLGFAIAFVLASYFLYFGV
jgi:hypothetical protein